MKTIKILYIAGALAFGSQSCSSEFLELTPKSSVTTGNFYKTQDQFNQALTGAYASIRNAKGSVASWVMGEMRSDNTFYEYNNQNRGTGLLEREDTDSFLDNYTSSYISDKYNSCYVGIARVNQILGNLESATLSEDFKIDIAAQAKFIRALLYFELVRYFGGVPLHLSAVTGAEEAYHNRSTAEEVYEAIEADLQEVIQRIPVVSFPQNGRVTKGAARVLLADVLITQKKYAEAEAELKAVTEMGYMLLPDYADVFDVNHKNSKESLFEIQYQEGDQGQHSDFVYHFLPLSADVSLITGITSQNRNAGGWNVPTEDLMEAYEVGDKRLEASIAIAEGVGPVGAMVIETLASPVDYVTPPGKRSYPFIKKYLSPHSIQNNTGNNFPIYRYADVLLLLAEALNEQGKAQEAIGYLNPVRERAGLNPITNADVNALREVILHERRIEFAFENKRWLDLVRTGKAVEVMNSHGEKLKAKYQHLNVLSYHVIPERLLYPIPQREILIGNLTQNPGY